MKEIWKQIPGYEKYEASDLGRIRSFKFKRIIKTDASQNGYERVIYGKEGTTYHPSISRLVLLAFVGSPLEGREASHLNNIRIDNKLCNLRWETSVENILRKTINNGKRLNLTDEEKVRIKNLFKQLGESIIFK